MRMVNMCKWKAWWWNVLRNRLKQWNEDVVKRQSNMRRTCVSNQKKICNTLTSTFFFSFSLYSNWIFFFTRLHVQMNKRPPPPSQLTNRDLRRICVLSPWYSFTTSNSPHHLNDDRRDLTEGFDVWGWRHRHLQPPQVRLFYFILFSTKFC